MQALLSRSTSSRRTERLTAVTVGAQEEGEGSDERRKKRVREGKNCKLVMFTNFFFENFSY